MTWFVIKDGTGWKFIEADDDGEPIDDGSGPDDPWPRVWYLGKEPGRRGRPKGKSQVYLDRIAFIMMRLQISAGKTERGAARSVAAEILSEGLAPSGLTSEIVSNRLRVQYREFERQIATAKAGKPIPSDPDTA